MFSRIKLNLQIYPIIAILLLSVIGCTPSSPSVVEPSQPAAESADAASAEESTGDEITEAVPDVAPVDREPLDLALDLDVQTVASVLDRDDVFLLDVREPREHEAGHIAGNILIPTGAIAERLNEIPKDKEVIVYCHSGARSARVTQFLAQQGYTNVHNMLGGIVAWQRAGLAVEQ